MIPPDDSRSSIEPKEQMDQDGDTNHQSSIQQPVDSPQPSPTSPLVTSASPHPTPAAPTSSAVIPATRPPAAVVVDTIKLPSLSAYALDFILRFCSFVKIQKRLPELSEVNFEITRSLEILQAANYLQIHHVFQFLMTLVSLNLPTKHELETLPSHIVDGLLLMAPLGALYTSDMMSEDRWRWICCHRWPIFREGEDGSPPRSNPLGSWRDTFCVKYVEDFVEKGHLTSSHGFLSHLKRSVTLASPHLRFFTIRNHTQFGPLFVKLFLRTSHPRLFSLDLSRLSIHSPDLHEIVPLLVRQPSLIQLNLSNNRIIADGVAPLAAFIRETDSLQWLLLDHNELGPDGATMIASSLQANTSITKLSIEYNQIGTSGAIAIADVLQTNTTLVILDLSNNQIEDEGIVAIGRALACENGHGNLLTHLSLYDNTISSVGVDAFLNLIETNHTLLNVSLGYSSTTDAQRARLKTILARNNAAEKEANDRYAQNQDQDAPTADEYAERRQHERNMLYGADTGESDSWCIIDEHWLTKWRHFVHPGSTTPPPGPITNHRLVNPVTNDPYPGMVDLYDYRGVSPLVWRMFAEIYGGGPEIPRPTLNLYSKGTPAS
ncbi:putative NLR Family CARD Domain Containing protein [Blattamonas nauphoetae]|uniref:NLR Family CARD Domain Containing protein n=1 Tax=Blattamonas nauphoetae TaxID=2049346 RepID=A0ABQ9Y4H0_9EUKA|nr:putative NLR Family CARD Domain Containing protein [Blattamonas nauphoetae]